MNKIAPIQVQSEPRITIAQFMKMVALNLSDYGKEIYECDQYPQPRLCITTDGIRNDVPSSITFGYNRHRKRFYELSRFRIEFPTQSAFESELYQVIMNYMRTATLSGVEYGVTYHRKQLVV